MSSGADRVRLVAFGTGICLTYIVSFSGQMYFFAGSMVKNIGTPLMSYREVLDAAAAQCSDYPRAGAVGPYHRSLLSFATGDLRQALRASQKD